MSVISSIFRADDQMSATVRKIRGEVRGLTKDSQSLGASIKQGFGIGVGFAAFNALTDAVGSAARAVQDFVGSSVSSAAEFERAMLNVNSIAKQTPEAFANMRREVLDLTKELPQTATDLARALYDINSSGFLAADGVTVLDAAARAASAGLATTADSAKGITAVLNAYHGTAEDAAYVSDVLFKTVDRGVLTFPELAQEIGDVTALAAPLGVTLEEVAAAVALLTRNGINAAEATTSVRAVMSSLLQPSSEARTLARDLGLEWDVQALKARGLVGVINDMITATGGNEAAMARLLGDARAIRGAFVLAANGGQDFNAELAAMQQAAGATGSALSYQQQGLAYQLDLARNAIDRTLIAVGDEILPIIKAVIPSLIRAVEGFGRGLVAFFQQNRDAIAAFVVQAVGFLQGLAQALASFFGVTLSFGATQASKWTGSISEAKEAQNDLAAQTDKTTDTVKEHTDATQGASAAWSRAQNALDGLGGSAGGAGRNTRALTEAIQSQIGALDEQIAKTRELEQTQDRAFRKSIEGLTDQVDAQLDALDAAEEARQRAQRDAALAARIAEAQGELVGASPEDQARIQARINDLLAEQEENRLRDAAEARREELSGIRDQISEIVAAAEEEANKRKALAEGLANEQELQAQRAAAAEMGNAQAVADFDLLIAAQRTTNEKLQQEIRNNDRIADLERDKEQLQGRLDKAREVASGVAGAFRGAGADVGATFTGMGDDFGTGVVAPLTTALETTLPGAFGKFREEMEEARKTGVEVGAAIGGAIGAVIGLILGEETTIGGRMSPVHKVRKGGLVQAFKDLKSTIEDLVGPAQKLFDLLFGISSRATLANKLRDEWLQTSPRPLPWEPGGNWPWDPEGRAHGGPVFPGRTYLVGEDGPELLRMGGSSGYVNANAGGSKTVNITLNASGVNDPARLVYDIRRELDRQGMSLA